MKIPKEAEKAVIFAREVLKALECPHDERDSGESFDSWARALPGSDVDDQLTRTAMTARLVILHAALASKSGWTIDRAMKVQDAWRRLKDLPLTAIALRQKRTDEKVNRARGIASHAEIRRAYDDRRKENPEEPKQHSRMAVWKELSVEHPGLTIRSVADATAEKGKRGRPRKKNTGP